MLLAGRTALVTGASKGVGKGIALELARSGCDVAINYHSDAPGADATAAEIQALGRQAMTVKANVGISDDVEAMFLAVSNRFPKLDILVNNAGVQTWKALLDLEEAEWDRVIDTNLKGTFLCTQRAARQMKERRRKHHQHRLRLQQGRVSASGRLYGEQGRHRDVHKSRGGRTRSI